MKYYCIEEFKRQFDKISSKSTYRSLSKETIKYFNNKPSNKLLSGTRLNNSADTPYIKKRIKGAGGHRFYYLLIIKSDTIYFMFCHPKTGALGYDNISDHSKASLYKDVLECINNNDLYEVKLNDNDNTVNFTKIVKK